jgi:hypothetical protein
LNELNDFRINRGAEVPLQEREKHIPPRSDIAAGVYHGASDAMGSKLYPRHFYECRIAPDAEYRR